MLEEISNGRALGEVEIMSNWLRASFAPILCELFFESFHELYTVGLYREIASQDTYNTLANLSLLIQGAFDEVLQMGYNVTFVYFEKGLNTLSG